MIYQTSVTVFNHVKIGAILTYAEDLDEGYRILVLVRNIKRISQTPMCCCNNCKPLHKLTVSVFTTEPAASQARPLQEMETPLTVAFYSHVKIHDDRPSPEEQD